MITQGLIIAAGQGSRLSNAGLTTPKPLQRVGGMPLIRRIIKLGERAGLKRIVVVVGFRKEEIIAELSGEDFDCQIDFVENEQWDQPNGLSVLAAKDALHENFVLLMSDHVFDEENLSSLLAHPMRDNEVVLAVDRKLDTIFDMDDATKVASHDGKVRRIGKELAEYDAIDTGMFLCTPKLFEALETAREHGQLSLSAAMQSLANHNQMGTFDIGEGFWQDVDTKETIAHAERVLLQKCRKSTDGFIARTLNRRVSLFFTKYLLKARIAPNYVTAFTTLIGMLSGYYIAQESYAAALFGAFLFKMTSILDGCDGELARITLSHSRLGQWLDTTSDNFTYVTFIVGLVIGVANIGYAHAWLVGLLALLGLAMSLGVMFSYVVRNSDSGSLLVIQKAFAQMDKKSLWLRAINVVQFAIKRDFFALFFLGMVALDARVALLWIITAATHLTWMALLAMQFGNFGARAQTQSEDYPTRRAA